MRIQVEHGSGEQSQASYAQTETNEIEISTQVQQGFTIELTAGAYGRCKPSILNWFNLTLSSQDNGNIDRKKEVETFQADPLRKILIFAIGRRDLGNRMSSSE